MPLPLLPGYPPPHPGPLARFLPPLAEGVAAGYVGRYSRPGDLVLDPFGSSPRVALEAAHLGRRVLAAVNNPINRFVLEMTVAPPEPAALRSVLSKLAAARKDETRLEVHLRDLYRTECGHCSASIQADYFIWERDAREPGARYYHCPHCGDHGEHPATQADVERARPYERRGLQYALALERIAPPDDPDREHAQEALAAYPPRAIYALFTLLLKLDGLALTPAERRLAEALLLSALDAANALWSHPEPRPRPRALALPPRFREQNVWLALERAVDEWTLPAPQGLSSVRPYPPRSGDAGDLSLFDGPIRDLPPTPGISLALTVLPRPNPAFWTLSALWAGWLWGREAAASFKSVLRRRRYDWNWHTAALRAAGEALAARLPEGAPLVGLAPEAEPGFTAAALAAFDAAGFALQDCALRTDPGAAQFLWRRAAAPGGSAPVAPAGLAARAQETGARAAQVLLQQRGEPARWAAVHAAGWRQLALERQLASPLTRDGAAAEPPLQIVNEALEAGISYRRGFLRLGEGSEADRESGLWWLREEAGVLPPLSDRVEAEVQRLLAAGAELTEAALDEAVCAAFPGLLTPGARLVTACLRSYGSQSAPGSSTHLPGPQAEVWHLRAEDDPRRRAAELEELRGQLIMLGARLGYTVTGATPLEWRTGGKVAYTLGIISSAAFSRYALDPGLDPAHTLVILPGGRAALAGHKLKRDPRLRLAVERGLRFVKYRLVRRLSDDTALTRDNFDERLKLDPLHDSEAQMSLL